MARLLEIRDLRVRFDTEDGRIDAVNGISYGIEEGEVLGVVGESGSGKSVHALAVMRLIPGPHGRIEGGQIRFRDRDLLSLPDGAMRAVRGKQIAMIFQDPISSLNPVYSVGFQIKETLRAHMGLRGRAAADRAADLLDLVGIPDARRRLDSYPHELSGGMRQRVMIAMALACDPQLVIADEPTTALDVTIQAQIIELIKGLQADLKLTVIWISHDLGIVAGLAQTVNVMYAGYIVERGAVRDIFKQPRHPYTLGLMGSMPRVDREMSSTLKPIPGRPPNLIELGPGCPFAPRCARADDRCRAEMPPVEPRGTEAQMVRCWHWHEVVAEGSSNV